MTKRIFKSMLIVASVILIASFIIILGFSYNYYTRVSADNIKTQTDLIARAVELEGSDYLDSLNMKGYRVTWISPDGTVLYDSEADAAYLENHNDREEFIEAVDSGFGESSRYSSTLTERMIYFAQRLSDGSVIRLASSQGTVLLLVFKMISPVCIVLLIAVILSIVLASRLAKRIVKPLNALDLDKPLENETYDELSPLLMRIEHQHRQIREQMRELERKQEEWNVMTGCMNEGIILLSENNVILSINESAARILGASADCVGQDMLSVCRSLDTQELLEQASQGIKTEKIVEFSGAEYQLNASPVWDDGKVKGLVLLFFDVTEKVHSEQIRREFTANVSHELKTPLHIISGTAERMKNGLVKAEDMPDFIDRIYSQSQRMIALVDDIIELSRLDEGMVSAPRDIVHLKTTAEHVAAQLAPEAAKENITLTVNGDDGVIRGVPTLIGELIYNLCDNAIKYNRPGGRVEVTVEDKASRVMLKVADTGIGIPSADRQRIFERFYRVDKSRSREMGGTGLGLSIVKHVAKLHDADIEMTSVLDKGTVFVVSFPKDE